MAMDAGSMKYCSACGGALSTLVPENDNRPRAVCGTCGMIHYVNPKLVVGCVPEHDGRILLCRRAIAPRLGFWTVPAGFMEMGETLGEAAIRETREEALASVELGSLFSVVDVVQAGQVHVFFTGRLSPPEFGVGDESLETRLFTPDEIPWDDLAFPSIRIALEQFLDNRQTGNVEVRSKAAPHLKIGSSPD